MGGRRGGILHAQPASRSLDNAVVDSQTEQRLPVLWMSSPFGVARSRGESRSDIGPQDRQQKMESKSQRAVITFASFEELRLIDTSRCRRVANAPVVKPDLTVGR